MEKTLIRIFGVLLLLFGFIGFFTNSFVGSVGYFYASTGMNIVNLLAGIILLGASSTEESSALTLKIAGAVYFVLAILGFAVTSAGSTANILGFMGVNMSANWLYAIGGLLMVGAGFVNTTQNAMYHSKSHA
ncbi:MAG TPA: DUF4383 domain-containing protein [Candidatus Paceibacterota bacterium]|jgi:hypothetical protein|nr:DUF4383 domain-containing protein [Candidatus Paceibacterota bacterium]